MTKFYLCRHGQTAWNQDERFRGRKDVPLSERGEREAEAVGEALAGVGVDAIYASPLARAVETFQPLARRLGKAVVPYDELIDLDFGDWEGLTLKEAEAQDPERFETWRTRPEAMRFPRGEGLAQVQARAMRAISRLALEFEGRTVAVCSHRVVTKLIVLGLLGAKPDRFWSILQDTACINRFQYEPPRAVVQSVNETWHLAGLGEAPRQDF